MSSLEIVIVSGLSAAVVAAGGLIISTESAAFSADVSFSVEVTSSRLFS